MRRPHRQGRFFLPAAGLLLAVAGLLSPLSAPGASAAPAAQDGSLVMVLDSSGSMAGPDGSGHTRIESARTAVGSVVDGLPDGYPTGLRVYGAGKTHGCDDTSLAQPVTALDRDAMKAAVAAVSPKGDTPTALALQKAAADLPDTGKRTILLISDGESNCGAPKPCDVAAQLSGDGIDLRIDTVGFQVEGAAKTELECVAKAGHGSYYDAPDAAALARQLVRASQLSADAYRMTGKPVSGGRTAADAAPVAPGQYVDTIGPGETRWYSLPLDAARTADLSATVAPQPGVAVDYGDGIETKLQGTGDYSFTCGTDSAHFQQDEGAMTLTSAVSRVPTQKHDDECDKAGHYLLSVHRTTAAGSDRSRWPLELRFDYEAALPKGMVPAAARTDYGKAPEPLTGAPDDVQGGTGFNDARVLKTGVWRDRLLPGQTRYYKVHVGWGQQLTYAAEFANEPVLDDTNTASTFVRTTAYAPGRLRLRDASDAHDNRLYDGSPATIGLGTVPVTWTNRWVVDGEATGVHAAGDYWIAVGLGPGAEQLARNTAVGVVLRVNVTGTELSGPQYKAPALASKGSATKDGGPAGASDASDGKGSGGASSGGTDAAASGGDGGGGLRAMDLVAAGTGGAVALAGLGAVALLQGRRNRTRRGGA
jgi:Ca-activated chloride channel family protein